MKESDFKIGISGLKVGKHAFDWKIDEAFFEEANPDLLEKARLDVDLVLKKSETMIEADISIFGGITLLCDRSLEPFEEPLSIEERIFFKYGDEPKELSEEVYVIAHNEEELDFSHLIYELVAVALPMKRLHPDYRDEDDFDEWIYVSDDSEHNRQDNEPADPRWEALKKLQSGSNGSKGS